MIHAACSVEKMGELDATKIYDFEFKYAISNRLDFFFTFLGFASLDCNVPWTIMQL